MKIMGIDWYEADGVLLAPLNQASDVLGEDNPLDSGVDVNDPEVEIVRIADALHRWSPEDGFYHA